MNHSLKELIIPPKHPHAHCYSKTPQKFLLKKQQMLFVEKNRTTVTCQNTSNLLEQTTYLENKENCSSNCPYQKN